MNGIYNYMPEANHVATVYIFVFILFLQFMLHVMLSPMLNVLYCYVNTFRSMCAVPNRALGFIL